MTVRPKSTEGRLERLSIIVNENEEIKSFLQEAWDENKGEILSEESQDKLRGLLQDHFLKSNMAPSEASNKARMFTRFVSHEIIKPNNESRAFKIGLKIS